MPNTGGQEVPSSNLGSPTGNHVRSRSRLVSFRHPEGDKVQAAYALEMADIRGPDAPTGGDGRGCYKAVMCTNVHTCRDQICPQAGMHACTKEIKRNRWKGGKDGLDKSLPPSTVLGRRPVHAVQQL